jgi:hypothetical protein
MTDSLIDALSHLRTTIGDQFHDPKKSIKVRKCHQQRKQTAILVTPLKTNAVTVKAIVIRRCRSS